MPTFIAADHSGTEIEITAPTPSAAAEAYVDGGDYHPAPKTYRLAISVWPAGRREAREVFSVSVHPAEPPCTTGDAHCWEWGSGSVRARRDGGVRIVEACSCGAERVVETRVVDPASGRLIRTLEYLPAG